MYNYSIAYAKFVVCVAYFFLFLLFKFAILLFQFFNNASVHYHPPGNDRESELFCLFSSLVVAKMLARFRFVPKSRLARRRPGRLARQHTPVRCCFLKKCKQALIDLLKLSNCDLLNCVLPVYIHDKACDRD